MTSGGRYSHRIVLAETLALLTLSLASCKKEEAKAPAQQAQGQQQGQAQGQGQDAGAAAASAPGAAAAERKPPSVQNAAEAKKYSGSKITFYGDAVAGQLDQALSEQFNKDTGIEVRVIPRPKDSSESYAAYQRMFQSQSSDV
ncbi:MAG TPA: hypothetical protein VE782_01185, partial [Myxococcaceae bacterium]|nr:hypothetical protein [Myxococcaceae bacterium]